MFDEILGKESGICGGLGGSLHLVDKSLGIMATSGIVAEAIPLAIGLALANKLYNKDSIVVVFFGDGATNSGVFYESLNFAAFLHLKILFVCENNGFPQSEKTSQLIENEDIVSLTDYKIIRLSLLFTLVIGTLIFVFSSQISDNFTKNPSCRTISYQNID